jgi:hypothetical protein
MYRRNSNLRNWLLRSFGVVEGDDGRVPVATSPSGISRFSEYDETP